MKLTFILLTVAFLQVGAEGVAQTSITYSGKKVKLETVFKAIEKQTDFSFFYKIQDLEKASPVSVELKSTPLEQALALILKDQQLIFTIDGKTIFISAKPPRTGANDLPVTPSINLPPLPIDVKGRVVDENGKPVIASVMVKGTGKGTTTNENGDFELKGVDENAVLVISGIAIETFEVKIIGRTDLAALNAKLKVTQGDEVTVTVNTGYQRISKERSAGSFSKPDMEVVAQRSTSMNVIQRMEGLVPGLAITNAPGTDGLLVRGLNSINSTRTPLIVVDGVPISNINSVNPQDVATIDVLKDATAASIWGAQASNGVIVITTKRGTPGDKIKVNYDGFISFQGKPDFEYQPLMNSQQYLQAAREIFDINSYTGTPSVPHEQILYRKAKGLISETQANKSLDSLASISNRDQIRDIWHRNASLMNHTLSLSGGGRVHTFYGSFAYTDVLSNRPGEKDRVYKANLRQDFNVSRFFKFYLIADLTNSVSSSPRNVTINNRFLPYQLFQDEQGNSLSLPYVGPLGDSLRRAVEARSRIGLDFKPLDDRNLATTNTNSLLNRLVGGATINLFKGLRYEGLISYIKGNTKTTLYDDNTSFVQRNEIVQFTQAASPAVTPVYHMPVSGGKFSTSNSLQTDWTIRNQFAFDRAWKATLHQVTLLSGMEVQERLTNTTQNTVRGYNRNLLIATPVNYAALEQGIPNTTINDGTSRFNSDNYFESEGQTRFTSYYSNGAYTYNLKYTVNGSWRIDRSNLFGLDVAAQGQPIWSVGAKWSIQDEPFMKNIRFVNRLALRATYGLTGNAPIAGVAASQNIFGPVPSASVPGGRYFIISSAANPKLAWEGTKTLNIGLDFSVLSNRLSGSIDLYNRKTENLIGNLPLNSLTGFSVITGNFGGLANKGVEVSLNSTNINTKNFRWITLLNGAYNKNEITGLASTVPINRGSQLVQQEYFVGYPSHSVFAYQYAGLDAKGNPMIYRADKTSTSLKDVSKPEDIRFMGTTQPPWTGGFSNIFQYKGFGLSINTIFNLGHVMRRDVGSFYAGRLTSGTNTLSLLASRYTSAINFAQGNIHPNFANRWKKPGDELITNVPAYISNESVSFNSRDIGYYTNADIHVFSASYLKIRDITISYTLPQTLASRIKTDNITFRTQLSNVMLWKANQYDIDPEFGSGLRNMQNTVTVGAHVSF